MSIRIGINAQVSPDKGEGGINGVLTGLVSALSNLEGEESYKIVGTADNREWLEQYMGDNQTLVVRPDEIRVAAPVRKNILQRILLPVTRSFVRKVHQEITLARPPSSWPDVPLSDGFWESLDCDVVHFPYQKYEVCALPTIYNPHDLLHLHYPQYFTPTDIAWRETIYPAGCHFSNTIAVASEWVKQDIIKQYSIHADKIQVVPWAPPTEAVEAPSQQEISAVRNKYQLDKPFAFFPAMTWEHKNHMRLIKAYQEAYGDKKIDIQIICSGKQHEPHWSHIKDFLDKEGLSNNVRFVGLVSEKDLRCLYQLAVFVIVPTLFEAASGPVFEAWHERVPVACSSVTSLPEQVTDAALLFDPYSIDSIKSALIRMANDEALREDLIDKGNRRLEGFSWERTAKAYRAVYRRAAGKGLTQEDCQLLDWDWMKNTSDRLT